MLQEQCSQAKVMKRMRNEIPSEYLFIIIIMTFLFFDILIEFKMKEKPLHNHNG